MDGRLLFRRGSEVQTVDNQSAKTLFKLPSDEAHPRGFLRWSPDGHSIAYGVLPIQENDPEAGLWVSDLRNPPHQIFRGWLTWYTRGPQNDIYLLEAKADVSSVLWRIDWYGHGLTRLPVQIPLVVAPWGVPFGDIDVSPDGRHIAFITEQAPQANIGMLEKIR
jgi:hypothetical protein